MKCKYCDNEYLDTEFEVVITKGKKYRRLKCKTCRLKDKRERRAARTVLPKKIKKKNRSIGNLLKDKQLGMSYGTACSKLRKQIMFSLVQKLNKDICYQCNKKIESIDEFSIEHKKPWLHNNSDLFWDLNNIAFSHLKCNIVASRRPNKRVVPEGKSYCSKCETIKELKEFPPIFIDKNSGSRKYCTKCATIQRSKYKR